MKKSIFFSLLVLFIGCLTLSFTPGTSSSSPPANAISYCSPMPAFDFTAFNVGPGDPERLYAFENRTAVTLTSAHVISVTPKHTLTVYNLMADTSVTFNAVSTYAIIGDRLVLKVSDTTSTRTLTFGTNFKAASDSATDGYTKIFEFVWTGDKYYLISKAGPYSN